MQNYLTEKQQSFCEHYVTSRNAVQAAISAGFSETYALKKAYQLLSHEKIASTISEIEKAFFSNHFKTLGRQAVKELETILAVGENRDKLRAIEMILKANGFTGGISIEAESSNTSIKVKLPDGL